MKSPARLIPILILCIPGLLACNANRAERAMGPEFRISRSALVDTPTPQLLPRFAADGKGNVYAIWSDLRGGEQPDAYLSFSRDGGLTWAAEDVRLDTDAPAEARSHFVRVLCDGQNVYAFWRSKMATPEDQREAEQQRTSPAASGPTGPAPPPTPELAPKSGNKHVCFRASHDSGKTWEPVIYLNSTVDAFNISAATAGGRVAALWDDERTPKFHSIWFNMSADGGRTWLPADARVDVPAADQRSSALEPVLGMDPDGKVYAVWQEAVGSNDCTPFFRSSMDGGITWDPDARILTDQLREFAGPPILSTDGAGKLLLAWFAHAETGPEKIRLNRSEDAGATWLPQTIQVDRDENEKARSFAPSLARNPKGLVVIAWQDRRNDNSDIYVNRSSDHGKTWPAEDIRLDGAKEYPGDFNSESPAVALDDAGTAVVVWHDQRNGHWDIYASWSADGGNTWLADPVRLDGDEAGAHDSLFPQVTYVGGGRFLVAWLDSRERQYELYARLLEPGKAPRPSSR